MITVSSLAGPISAATTLSEFSASSDYTGKFRDTLNDANVSWYSSTGAPFSSANLAISNTLAGSATVFDLTPGDTTPTLFRTMPGQTTTVQVDLGINAVARAMTMGVIDPASATTSKGFGLSLYEAATGTWYFGHRDLTGETNYNPGGSNLIGTRSSLMTRAYLSYLNNGTSSTVNLKLVDIASFNNQPDGTVRFSNGQGGTQVNARTLTHSTYGINPYTNGLEVMLGAISASNADNLRISGIIKSWNIAGGGAFNSANYDWGTLEAVDAAAFETDGDRTITFGSGVTTSAFGIIVNTSSGTQTLDVPSDATLSLSKLYVGDKAGTTNSTVALQGGGAVTVNSNNAILLGGVSGATGRLVQSAGSFTANTGSDTDMSLGTVAGATGIWDLSGGTATVRRLELARAGTGQINLSGTAVLTLGTGGVTVVGQASGGSGTINVSGGTLDSSTQNIFLGSAAGAFGYLDISGGSVQVFDFCPGSRGTGTVVISDAGSLSTRNTQIGQYATAVGSVTLNGGTFSVAQYLNIGSLGKGTLTINTGGSVSNTNALHDAVTYLGALDSSLVLAGGTLTTDQFTATQAASSVSFGSGSLVTGGTSLTTGWALVVGDGVGTDDAHLDLRAGGTHTFDTGLTIASDGKLTFGGGGTMTVPTLIINGIAGNGDAGTVPGWWSSGTINTGATTVDNGAMFVVGNDAGSGGTLNLQGGTHSFANGLRIASEPSVLTGNGTISADVDNDGTVSVTTGTMQINGNLDGDGTATVDASATLNANRFRQGSLTVNGNAKIAAGGTSASILGALSVGAAGQLDMTDNDAIVHNGDAAAITASVAAGRGDAYSPTWDQAGIVSSVAKDFYDNNYVDLVTVGVVLNSDFENQVFLPQLTEFDGETVTSTDVLVKYTYMGDADLTGEVDGSDYQLIDTGYNFGLTAMWVTGDFNYDGAIDGSDYQLIDTAYGLQLFGPLGATTAAGAVPEPASLSLVALGAMGLLSRRRRD